MTKNTSETVEVVYALPDEQRIVEVPYSPTLTALEAVERSGLLAEFPEIRSEPLVLGVFGEPVAPGRVVGPGTRIEICRQLKRDPREMRWELARLGETMGRRRHDDGD